MAAPQVAGALALLLSARPYLGADAQESLLRTTAVDLGPAGADDSYGAGRIDLAAAFAALTQPDITGPEVTGQAAPWTEPRSARPHPTCARRSQAPSGSRDPIQAPAWDRR